jgi:hypothetical protein
MNTLKREWVPISSLKLLFTFFKIISSFFSNRNFKNLVNYYYTYHKMAILSVADDSIIPVGGFSKFSYVCHTMGVWMSMRKGGVHIIIQWSLAVFFKRVQSPCAVASVSRRAERRTPFWPCPSFPFLNKKRKENKRKEKD